MEEGEPPIEWWCIEGGSEVLVKKMYDSLAHKNNLHTSHRVTSISRADPNSLDSDMKITVQHSTENGTEDPKTLKFSHVVSTVPFSALRSIDLSGCGLSYKQKMALRCLHYGPSVKVAIKFRTRWWQYDVDLGSPHEGGQSSTDRPSRVVVYPSHGLNDPEDNPGVLIASYSWFVVVLMLRM